MSQRETLSSSWHILSLLEGVSGDASVSELLRQLRVPDVLTENGAAAFSSTDSPFVDLLGKLTRDLDVNELHRLFDLCWLESPVRLVQLIHYTRDCRSALGEKKLFYEMALRLRRLYPLTYLRNLQSFIEAGYFKDLLVILEMCEISDQPKLASDDFIELVIFKQQLLRDKNSLDQSSTRVSLAAKWAPSEGRHFDKFGKRLAKLIFGKHPQIHREYRKLLSRLRNHLEVVEISMCANSWSAIEYEHVPSKAMKNYSNAFKKHDQERFAGFLQAVKGGVKKVNSAGLQPHELVAPYIGRGVMEVDETLECLWTAMMDKLKKNKLKNTLAVVDVSGSMEGLPMTVAIALGLVCAEMTEGPFHNVVCTFSEKPNLVKLSDSLDSLKARVEELERIPWGMNTNFEAVIDLILTKYRAEDISPSDLPEIVICFTDMQFDEASSGLREEAEPSEQNPLETLYDVVKRKFEAENLTPPRFVFWNLRASQTAVPIKSDTPNTALISGYSAELLKMFLFCDGQFDPLMFVSKALDGRPASVDLSEQRQYSVSTN